MLLMTLAPSLACSAFIMLQEEEYLRALAFPLPAQAVFFYPQQLR